MILKFTNKIQSFDWSLNAAPAMTLMTAERESIVAGWVDLRYNSDISI